MSTQTKKANISLKQYGMGIALIVIFLIFSFLSDGKNYTPMNINNLVMQNSYVVILAIGMLLCIITGNVDLSVGSVVAFIGAITAILILDVGLPIWLVVIMALGMGLLIGMWQGIFIAYLGYRSFILTIPYMLDFRVATYGVLHV